jgi:signal transduction histidine kinase
MQSFGWIKAGTWLPGRLAWLPIPLLMAAIAGIWVVEPSATWHFPPLFWLLAYGPVIIAIGAIVLPTARAFLDGGQRSVLMLGCGVWVFSLGVMGGAGAASRSLNLNWTIYNLAFLLSALCHVAGVAAASRGRIRLDHALPWLVSVYLGSLAAVGLIAWGAFAGAIPPFHHAGRGGTLLHDVVVLATVLLFLVSAGLLWQTHRRAPSPFLSWYALGLVLIATGLAGSMLIDAGDSPMQWVTRSARAWGTVYLCLAVRYGSRAGRAGQTALAAVAQAWRERAFTSWLRQWRPVGWGLRYGSAVLAVAIAFLMRLGSSAWAGPGLPPYVTFYPAVMTVAMVAGFGPGLLASVLAGLMVQYWVLEPVGQFAIASPVDRLGLVIFMIMGVFMCVVAELYRHARDKAASYDREAALGERLKEEARRKDDFLAVLAHELRNPLTPIRNAVYLLRKQTPNPEPVYTIIERQVVHLGRLVDDLLDVSRISRGKVHLKLEATDLAATVRGVIADYQPVLDEHGLALEAGWPAEPVWIAADHARVVQIVSNLLHNAIKFTDPGGTVSVAVGLDQPGWCLVRIKDNGQGIRPEQLDSVFEPFMQAKETIGRSEAGLGLGLALVKGLVTLHGGTVAARSEGPGRGAEFTVLLPLLQGATGSAPARRAGDGQAGDARRVLIVEDLVDSALTLRLLLQMQGHMVEIAQDGRTGLDKAASFLPEIILCDIGLPGELSGYDVARSIRAMPGLRDIQLVALSGFGSPEDKAMAAEAGFDLHLTKPVDPARLGPVLATPAARSVPPGFASPCP